MLKYETYTYIHIQSIKQTFLSCLKTPLSYNISLNKVDVSFNSTINQLWFIRYYDHIGIHAWSEI